jgi:archaellum component FlaG (FlaF/FlaG flagellin family)
MDPNMQAPVAKKTSVWVWILGGIVIFLFAIMLTCSIGGYMLYRGVKHAGFDSELMKKNPGLAMAKMATAINPDYETVSTDDSTGTIVVREKSTGKKITMKFDPETKQMVVTDSDGKQSSVKVDTSGANGGVTLQSADGTVKFGSAAGTSAPAWVPVYPGSSPQNTMSSTTPDGSQNTFTFKSPDAASKIIAYYSDQLKSGGFSINMTTNTEQGGMVQATDEGKKRTISVIVGSSAEGTETAVTSIEKK